MILRPYQEAISEQALGLLRLYNIAYLTLEVRVGKTAISLVTAKRYGAKKVLFVTKLKAIGSIQRDYEAIKPGYDLYLVNYESPHKVETDFDFVIIDEAHSLGQFPKPSNRTRELRRICAGKPIIYLSGTPTPESYSQIYHQLWVSSFSPFANYANFYAWHKVYGIPAVKYLYNRQIADYSKTKGVMEAVQHLFISYTQEQAGFSSPVVEEFVTLPMPDAVRNAIRIVKRDKLLRTKEGYVILADTEVKEMQKVHQMCGGTVKTECGKAIVFDKSKAEYIRDNFKGKVAIFYKFVAEGEALRQTLTGIVEDSHEFNKHEGPCYYISQIQSGREGVNLSTADCIVFYNIDFSALSYWQARARLQALERKEPARVYWLFFSGGIEAKIYLTVSHKKNFTLSHYRKG